MKKKSTQPAPMSAEGLKHVLEQNQMPATATEQAIGGRKANPTPKPNPSPALDPDAKWGSPEDLEKAPKVVKVAEAKVEKPKKVKKTTLKPIIEKIHIRFDLTDSEIATIARLLGGAEREYLEIEAQLKSIKSDFKSRTDKVTAEINRITNVINAGYEMREVETLVLVVIDKATKNTRKAYYDRATGKMVRDEPFSVDGQLDMFALHPKPADYKKKLSEKIIRSAV